MRILVQDGKRTRRPPPPVGSTRFAITGQPGHPPPAPGNAPTAPAASPATTTATSSAAVTAPSLLSSTTSSTSASSSLNRTTTNTSSSTSSSHQTHHHQHHHRYATPSAGATANNNNTTMPKSKKLRSSASPPSSPLRFDPTARAGSGERRGAVGVEEEEEEETEEGEAQKGKEKEEKDQEMKEKGEEEGGEEEKNEGKDKGEEEEEEEKEGYNSADEHSGLPALSLRPTSPQDEVAFETFLKKQGLSVRRMKGDGNCLFRAVADQVYGDQEMHDIIRKNCMDFMQGESAHYSQFIAENFDDYIRRKRQDKEYGNNIELQALTELFNRPIQLYAYGHEKPLNIFHGTYTTDNPPLRLSYHHGNHYNSVVDPNNPTFGVGLGLPGLQPGLADKLQLERAQSESELALLEQNLLRQSQLAADWEATELELEEAILRQSEQEYWDSLLHQMQQQQEAASTSTTSSTSSSTSNYSKWEK
ncbi:OTU domain-containing protein [Balamuthia mandrillaris]